jgi:TetR/AcrR family transcriptional regulator, copper-responsive repressor
VTRGRPKQFTRESLIEKAMPVFWNHGYASTSVAALEHATGVNKSGIYSEFADKQDFFLSCLRHYYATQIRTDLLQAEPLGWDNIRRFLESSSNHLVGRMGCFGVNTLRELKDLSPEARKMAKAIHANFIAMVSRNIAAERPGENVAALAETVAFFFYGLSVECNFVQDEAGRKAAIASFMAAMRGGKQRPRAKRR